MRVLKWIVDRCQGRASGHETAIGWVPRYEDMDFTGLDFSRERWNELMDVRAEALQALLLDHEALFPAAS